MGVLFFAGCNNAPTVVAEEGQGQERITEKLFKEKMGNGASTPNVPSNTAMPDDMHQVVVKEVLPTDKYVYLRVEENGEAFWIATTKQPVKVGEKVFYKGGLLKTNFESKEYHRTFDKIYLVSRIVPANHSQNPDFKPVTPEEAHSRVEDVAPIDTKIEVKGSLKITDLVKNAKNYAGQKVQISGKVVKANYNIMGRNWLHLKDGSKDDFDLVITSNTSIPEGHIVTMKGIVRLDKDFGAGYRYSIIVEDGELVK